MTTGRERGPDDPARAWLAAAAARGAAVPAYDTAAVRPSVVHIGPGVFHRAHQAVYGDEVLATGSATGGICAVSLRSADLHRALARQGHLYTLLERDDGGDRHPASERPAKQGGIASSCQFLSSVARACA